MFFALLAACMFDFKNLAELVFQEVLEGFILERLVNKLVKLGNHSERDEIADQIDRTVRKEQQADVRDFDQLDGHELNDTHPKCL